MDRRGYIKSILYELISKGEEDTMRVTVHIKDALNKEIKRLAANEHKSLSLLISESVEFYIKEKKRRELGNKVLDLVGKRKVNADTLRYLDEGRLEHDRS